VVYEAEQVSLRRRVALKVLPFAAVMDTRSMQRFKNEALAAAGLDHPNVVKVHAVGCDRGVHYIAMQFVDGRTLADLIAEQRPKQAGAEEGDPAVVSVSATPAAETQPAAKAPTERVRPDAGFYRRAAEWAAQAADALEHAHGLGVVHRDVKPANLMVDGRGHLWVTDFGLALVATDPALTASGDLIGTPRYMSPEQARAKHGLVDHRTDIYALGATFYELLTCESAVVGREREDVLRNLASADPVPLRKHDRHIPADLETVVLKCLEKDAARRYQSARELADDLRRILEDKPIQAKPPTLLQRTAKWTRRHKPVAASLAVALLTTAVLAVGAGFWHQRRQAETKRAVTTALTQAETLVAEGDKQTDRPERWQATARLAQVALEKAEEFLAQGVGTEELAARVRQVRAEVDAGVRDSRFLIEVDGIRLERNDSSGAALTYAAAFRDYGLPVLDLEPAEAARRISNSAIREHLLAVVWDWSSVTKDLAALERLSRVIELSDSTPWRQQVIAALKHHDQAGLARLAQQSEALDQPPGLLVAFSNTLARTDLPGAVKLLRQAQRRHPSDLWINHQLAFFLSRLTPPELDEAISYYRAALALRPQSPGVHNNLGIALKDRGRLADAEAEYREAIRLSADFSAAHINLGYALADMRRLDEALTVFQEAVRLKRYSAEALTGLARCLGEKGRLEESITASLEAIRLKPDGSLGYDHLGVSLAGMGRWDEALTAHMAVICLKPEIAPGHFNLGTALLELGRTDEAVAAFREAIRLKPDYPAAYNNLGKALGKAGRTDEAIAAYREAIRLKPDYANAHYGLGFQLAQQGRFDEAAASYKDTIRVKPDHANARVALTIALDLRELNARLAKVLSGERQPANAGERVQFALQCLQPYKQLTATAARFYLEAFAAEPKLAEDQRAAHRYNAACAAAQAGCGQGADAKSLDDMERARLRRQARDWLRADLAAWSKQLDETGSKAAPLARQTMQHWSADTDFAGVRGADALAKLPEAERQDWQKLWGEVADTLTRAEGKILPAKKSESK
jgi:tetratricopeptide (TPR) repeat protein